ncbi:MAG TPA: PKD domain-containing protein [Kiritimatiellia bacterium]|nr:PKD domain-containing protein [Kiritimatiellia bacterium]HRZ12513.1 PKD domain-containing protein [Kiritimatiellia bacterium]HSA17729.1 PKD domain-containing protein [Kiritimatiellia bacterium]
MLTLYADTHYVDLYNPTPLPPFTNWPGAANSIQAAIDEASDGDTVLVSNGMYVAGGRTLPGVSPVNRVIVTQSITVASVNGPSAAAIVGQGPLGTSAVRCLYLNHPGALVSGFTLTNGHTATMFGTAGGGAYIESGVLSNCIVASSHANDYGGGVHGGMLYDCWLKGNTAGKWGGGAIYSVLSNCTIEANTAAWGGGARSCTLYNCRVIGNLATNSGGGAIGGTIYDSELRGNTAISYGGGVYGATIFRSQIANNSALAGGGVGEDCEVHASVLSSNIAQYGGGAGAARLYSCRLEHNVATGTGGGASGGSLFSCAVYNNQAQWGGGTQSSSNWNCSIVANTASGSGGGVRFSWSRNCIIYDNDAPVQPNHEGGDTAYSCTTPAISASGNMSAAPHLVTPFRLASSSPCLGAGSEEYMVGADLDGEPWRIPPAMGCDELYPANLTGSVILSVIGEFAQAATDFAVVFRADTLSAVASNLWDFGDGVRLTNYLHASHAWSSGGLYTVSVTAYNLNHPTGVTAAATIMVVDHPVHYVNVHSPSPAYPFTNWTTAATTIQSAVNAAIPGSLVLVTDGIYNAGGAITPQGILSNRVVITNGVALRSVNGPDSTFIVGAGPLGSNAMRGVFLSNQGRLDGFTITNGHTRFTDGVIAADKSGGGIFASGGIVTNCIITGNSARTAGGAHFGEYYNCGFFGNRALNYVIWGVIFDGSGYGGGVNQAMLHRCWIEDNLAEDGGGGAGSSQLFNCIVRNNRAFTGYEDKGISASGGGAYRSSLYGCTVISNSAALIGGVDNCRVVNSIVYYNTASQAQWGHNYTTNRYSASTFSGSCTTPHPADAGNISSPPEFADDTGGDYHLAWHSSCVDAGVFFEGIEGLSDYDGRPRVFHRPDIGAYEYVMETDIRVKLAGASGPFSGDMRTDLARLGYVPMHSLYAATQIPRGEMPSNATDWILVELLDPQSGVSMAAEQAILRCDGTVLSDQGGAGLHLEASPGSYFLTIKHRNHLSVMSAQPLDYTNATVFYDFTTGPEKARDGTNSLVEVTPGAWGMIAGDADGDGKITAVDRSVCTSQVGRTGYLAGDFNLDGVVTTNE